MDEPLVDQFVIINEKIAEHTPIKGDPVDVPVNLLIGFVCVGPEEYARISSHHQILHRELNSCRAQNRSLETRVNGK